MSIYRSSYPNECGGPSVDSFGIVCTMWVRRLRNILRVPSLLLCHALVKIMMHFHVYYYDSVIESCYIWMILRTKYKIRCTFLKNKLLPSSGKVALKCFMNKKILCEYYYLEVAELKYSLAYTIKLPSQTLVKLTMMHLLVCHLWFSHLEVVDVVKWWIGLEVLYALFQNEKFGNCCESFGFCSSIHLILVSGSW